MRSVLTRLASMLMLVSPSLAKADAISDFYHGKDVTFIVAYDVGGGYDQYARLLARHIGRHIPGQPNIIVMNMPGAGGIRAANNLFNVAPRNGAVLGMIDQALPLQELLEPENVKASAAKFNWIGRLTSNASILYAWSAANFKTIRDAFDKELIVASTGQNSRMMSTFMKNQLGMKLKIVTGYKGAAESRLAMERGEIHALTQPWSVVRTESQDWLRDGKINLLLQIGVDKNADLPSVPLVVELARDENERQLLTLLAGGSRIGRSIASPPGQPPERVEALRKAFLDTMNDSAFLSEAKQMGLDLDPLPGADLQAFIESSTSVSPELVAKARSLAAIDEAQTPGK